MKYSRLHLTPASYQYPDNYSSTKTDTSKTSQKPTVKNTYSREFDQMACLECYFVPHEENSYDATTFKKIKWLRS